MRPYVATFYRGRWLYVLVLLIMLAGSAAGAYYLASSRYEVTARIWVVDPPLDKILGQDSPYQPSPAQQQGDLLSQLLQTDSFITAVIKETSLSGQLTGDPESDNKVIDKVRTKLWYGTVGSNTVAIGFSGPDPVLCQQIVKGTIDQFRSWILQSRLRDNAAQMQFYQKQVGIYKVQMDNAKSKLDEFNAAHPNIPKDDSQTLLQLQQLQQVYESARQLYTTTVDKLDQTGIVENLSKQQQQADFQVLDEPKVPQEPTMSPKTILMYLALGMGASFGLVFAIVLLLTWMDRTIRTPEDLARLSEAPVLAVIPHLQRREKRRWRPWKRHGTPKPATRRAIDMLVSESES